MARQVQSPVGSVVNKLGKRYAMDQGLQGMGMQQQGGGLFGNMFGSSAGGGSFMGTGGGGSSGTPWGLLALATALGQGAGDRQSEGSFGSRFQEGFIPSPYKAWRHSPKEGAIASFAPFMNFFREPDIGGAEEGERLLGILGM